MSQTIIAHPNPDALLQSYGQSLEESKALVVKDPASYKRSGELMVEFATAIKVLEKGNVDSGGTFEGFDKPCQAADQAHKFLVKLRTAATSRFYAARQEEGNKQIAYEAEQKRKAEEEQRRLEAEARAKEQERQLNDAIDAEANGDKAGAEEILAAPVEIPVIPAPVMIQKVEGVSSRILYGAEVVNLIALVQHVAQHPEDVNLLAANQTALNARARSQRDGFRLPGCKLVKTTNKAVRTA